MVELANISFMLLNWLFASQAINDMETCELASTLFLMARKGWMVWQNSLRTHAMPTYPEGPIPSWFLPTHNTAITTTHAETLVSLVEDRLFFEKASSQTHMEQQYV